MSEWTFSVGGEEPVVIDPEHVHVLMGIGRNDSAGREKQEVVPQPGPDTLTVESPEGTSLEDVHAVARGILAAVTMALRERE